MRTRAYRYSRSTPAFPAQWFTAYAELSPETNSFCLRRRRIDGIGKPGRACNASADLTPATGARTTRFCRTLQCRSSAAPPIAHGPKPALRSLQRSGRCRVHRIPTHVRDDRDTPLLAGRNGRSCRADLGRARRSIFLRRRLDGANHVDRVEEISPIAHRPSGSCSSPAIVNRWAPSRQAHPLKPTRVRSIRLPMPGNRQRAPNAKADLLVRVIKPCERPEKQFHAWGKPRLGQPDCIFRLGRPCSFFKIACWLWGQGVSQFSFMFLLVTALTLTVCVGVAAWRISDDRPDVTGSTSSTTTGGLITAGEQCAYAVDACVKPR
jgi:hypothetical protein